MPRGERTQKSSTFITLNVTAQNSPTTNDTVRSIIRDGTIQEQIEAEKELLATQKHLLDKSESLDRMAGAIAHHFNNQLQGVMGNLEIGLLECPNHARTIESMTGAMQSAAKAAEMSRLMLTYLGQDFSVHELMDLADSSRRILSLVRPIMPPGVLLEAALPSPGPTVCADPKHVHQILANLVTNAWEATDKPGNVIRVTTKTVSATEISAVNRFPVDWQPSASAYGCVEVTDAGDGIAPENIEKIFNPFFTSKSMGRGLGLSVVLGSARNHKGGITVKSELGRGSVFQVFFPISQTAVPQRFSPADQALKSTDVIAMSPLPSRRHNLNRFVDAQAGILGPLFSNYRQALHELQSGRKETHWIWYVFPQLRGLGTSEMSVRYGIESREEARAYLNHPVLGERLRECVNAMKLHKGTAPERIFSPIDAAKYRSCLTLFKAVAGPESVFADALNDFYQGRDDGLTIELLASRELGAPAEN